MQIIKTGKLPAKEGSLGKVKIMYEGFGRIQNEKIVIQKCEITKLEFIKQDVQNQPLS